METNITFIKHRGSPKEATLYDGTKVVRKNPLYVPTIQRFVATAPYDNHFVYLLPTHIVGWALMCTCGGGAGIIGYKDYAKDAQPTTKMESTIPGELVVCLAHAESGKHADGST